MHMFPLWAALSSVSSAACVRLHSFGVRYCNGIMVLNRPQKGGWGYGDFRVSLLETTGVIPGVSPRFKENDVHVYAGEVDLLTHQVPNRGGKWGAIFPTLLFLFNSICCIMLLPFAKKHF